QNTVSATPLPAAPIQFVPGGPSVSVGMLDQESQPVRVANLPVGLQSYLTTPRSFSAASVSTVFSTITFAAPHGFATAEPLAAATHRRPGHASYQFHPRRREPCQEHDPVQLAARPADGAGPDL